MDRLNRSAKFVALALIVAGLLAWPAVGLPPANNSPTFTGSAYAVQETTLAADGTASTTMVADTGGLGGANDARNASQLTAGTPSVTAETPAAATISWSDEVDSTASVNNLNVTVGGVVITANSVISKVISAKGPNNGITIIDGLAVNGTPISVTGAKNQNVSIPGGQLIINEINNSGGTMTVNALHIIMNGASDVVIASSTAGAA